MSVLPTAVPKYSREAYAQIVAMMPASAGAFPNYEKLLEKTERGKQRLIELGGLPHEIEVEPVAYKAWCESESKPIGRESLAEFLMVQLANKYGRKN